MRKTNFATNYVYHVYNRGVEKRKIFLDSTYYFQFVSLLNHYLKYNYPFSFLKRRLRQAQSSGKKQKVLLHLKTRRINPPVEIISFCLMPNHYHLILKQLVENGITNFMHKIGTAYTNYFNIRQERKGRLFEVTFKTVMIESDEQLIYLTRYQHLNPRALGIVNLKELIDYSWSSLSTYLGNKQFLFVRPDIVLSNFKGPKSYLDFILGEVDELEALRLEKIAIDDDFSWFTNFRKLDKAYQEQLRQHYLEMLVGNFD